MNAFVENNRLTARGHHLVRLIDTCIARKTGMTDELRHYAAAVYRTRLMKPVEWFQKYPDKVEALWAYFDPQPDVETDEPPRTGRQPWLLK